MHPKKSGAEVMLALEATDATQSEDKKLFNILIELLSYEKIIFNGNLDEPALISNLSNSSLIKLRFTNETVPNGRVCAQALL